MSASAPSPIPASRLERREALVAAVRAGAIKRVLAVRFARLGDVVFTLPALDVLGEALPDARVDYLTSAGARDLVAPHPLVSEVLLFEPGWHRARGRARRAARVGQLRERDYDLMLVLESDRPTRDLLEGLAREAGIPHVVSRSSFVPPPDDPPTLQGGTGRVSEAPGRGSLDPEVAEQRASLPHPGGVPGAASGRAGEPGGGRRAVAGAPVGAARTRRPAPSEPKRQLARVEGLGEALGSIRLHAAQAQDRP